MRWWQLFPLRNNKDKTPAVPTEGELKMLMTPARSKQLRSRLSDISWWMRALAEPIARRSSIEDKCTVLDWTGRQVRRGTKRGPIPGELAPIMERIGLSGELWCYGVMV